MLLAISFPDFGAKIRAGGGNVKLKVIFRFWGIKLQFKLSVVYKKAIRSLKKLSVVYKKAIRSLKKLSVV